MCTLPAFQDRPLIYLAAPYSNPDPSRKQENAEAIDRAESFLIACGFGVFNPVRNARFCPVRDNSERDWYEYDLVFLRRCDAVVVMMREGWMESRGVEIEVGEAHRLRKPVWYMSPDRWNAKSWQVPVRMASLW